MKIKEIEKFAPLYDCYSALLTEKQRYYFEMYYFNDYSLGEIASNLKISRNAVFDIIKKTQNILIDYESKLKLALKKQKTIELLDSIDEDTREKIKKIEEI